MPFYQSTYRSKLYQDFTEIEGNDYREIIRFYEENENQIKHLDGEEHFYLLTTYVNSLFEIGAYQKHLTIVDLVIEISIEQNIVRYQGVDLFQNMLFKKAASCYNTLQYKQAEHILRELIKIDPKEEETVLFLKRCLRKKTPGVTQFTRASSIFLFLLTAVIISFEVLFIRPFYDLYTPLVEGARFSTFAAGCLILVTGDLFHRWRAERKANRFVRNEKLRKTEEAATSANLDSRIR